MPRSHLHVLLTVPAVALWLALQGPAQRAPGRPGPNFASFEVPDEVARWKPVGPAQVQASTDFPSWQTHSLKVTVPAGATGGVETDWLPANWHRQEALQFFVYAEQPTSLTIELASESSAASRTTPLRKGAQHVQVRLREFSGVDLRNVTRLRLSLPGPATVYLDRFRLTEYNETLAQLGRMDAPYGTEIETPHVAWARPYAAGPIELLIVPDVANGRAAIELAQRLECRLHTVTLGSNSGTNRWGFGDFYGERGDSYGAPFTLAYTYLADALLNGPHYDVMVLPGSRPWEEFPAVVRQAIRRRVEQGMGLVLLGMQAKGADWNELSPLEPIRRGARAQRWVAATPHFITRNVPLEAFPYEQLRHWESRARGDVLIRTETGDPVLAVRSVGQGRVVAAAWEERGLIPLVQNQWRAEATWRYWEYMYSLLARAVIWAARKEAPGGIEAMALDDPARPSRVSIRGRGPAVYEVTVRDEYWDAEHEGKLPAPEGKAELALPAPPRGEVHFVDVVARDPSSGRVLDWGTLAYRTSLPTRIREIRLDQDRFRRGDPVTGRIALEGAARGWTLRIGFADNYGRLLATRDQPLEPGQNEISFSFPSEDVLTRLAWVESRLLEGSRERHRKRADVFILQPRRWEDFDVVMYLFGPDPAPGLWPTIERRLRDMQVTTLSSYPLELSKHANFGVQAQTRISGQESPDGEARKPYLEQKRRWRETGDKKYLARLYCLSDPAYRRQQEREIEKLVTPWVPFSPMSYYIYEEPSLTCYTDAFDLCFSPHCMARMREWLKREYGSLEALNRQWGTQFPRWDDVIPDTTEEAQRRGNYSSWADHRTFMEEVYAENYAYVRSLLHRHDPDGLVLLSGTQESVPHNGCDYSRLNYIVGHLNPYTGGNQLEFLRSFNPGLRMSVGTGYGVKGRRTLYNLYNGLFHGFTAGAYIFWQYSILNPDFRFCGSAESIRTALTEIRDGGVARLLRTAERSNDGIAIHYSFPSIHGAWIVDGRTTGPDENPNKGAGPTFRKFEANRDGWVNLLKDLGFGFDFLARQQIEAGELKTRKFRALILPFSVSLTNGEVRAIREFVEGGGIVIADGQAGVMDGHARWLDRSSLDDLFGIARPRPARQAELASEAPEKTLRAAQSRALADLDGAPAVLVREQGSGKAVYLNFFLSTYVEDRRDRKEGRWKDLVRRGFEWAGLRPPYRVVAETGDPLENFLLVHYRRGAARLLGLLKNDEPEVRTTGIRVDLGAPAHIYDVRQKRYLGRSRTLRDRISSAEPKLYALLPAPVARVRVEAPRSVRPGEAVSCRLAIEAGQKLDTVLLFRVYRPGGELAHEYSENLETKDGVAARTFRLALNDPPGRWRIVATDAVSGQRAVHELVVR